jgi:glycosyltransferase involved in cell wall biosynthesis
LSAPPLVSVVVPVWNGERYFSQAIQSVLEQTLQSLELIVVDDGSTDASVEIAEGWAERDPRVRLLRIEHGGIAAALNAGLAVARGRFFARMDADDIAHPSRLERQTAYLDANPRCVAVGCAMHVIDEAGAYIGVRFFPERHDEVARLMVHTWSTAMAHPTLVARREAMLAIDGYRSERLTNEDLDILFRLSEIGTLANLSEPLLTYRRHRNTVGIRDHNEQVKVGAEIVNEVRRTRGLKPLRPLVFTAMKSGLASYHFECARTALLTGPRSAAIRHARAAIASEPSSVRAYAALIACIFPKWTLRSLHVLRALAMNGSGARDE